MFGLFDLFMKRVTDQSAEYAAARSDIARRSWGEWTDPFHTLQLAKVTVDHRPYGGTPRGEASRRQRF